MVHLSPCTVLIVFFLLGAVLHALHFYPIPPHTHHHHDHHSSPRSSRISLYMYLPQHIGTHKCHKYVQHESSHAIWRDFIHSIVFCNPIAMVSHLYMQVWSGLVFMMFGGYRSNHFYEDFWQVPMVHGRMIFCCGYCILCERIWFVLG